MRTKNGFIDICNREKGLCRPRRFAHQFSADQEIVKQLDMYAELKGHNDQISSTEFNSGGDLIVSGSFDKQVIFWNWETKTRRLSYDSGHPEHVYQTKIMPLTDDRRIVTACKSGQVRLGEVLEDGRVHTKRLGSHRSAVYKLAVEPGNPNILYSCGQDSIIQHFDLRTNSATKLFRCGILISEERHHFRYRVSLFEMAVDPWNPNYICLGGSDAYARVYDIRECWPGDSSRFVKPVNLFRPAHLIHPLRFGITGLAYSNSGELLVSYTDELTYLFQKNMGLGPSTSFLPLVPAELDKPEQFIGHRTASSCRVSFFGPNDEYVMSGSDCGHIFIWKKNGGELVRVMMGDSLGVLEIQPHPHDPVIATCGQGRNLKIWAPMENDDASALPHNITEIMGSNSEARRYFNLQQYGTDEDGTDEDGHLPEHLDRVFTHM